MIIKAYFLLFKGISNQQGGLNSQQIYNNNQPGFNNNQQGFNNNQQEYNNIQPGFNNNQQYINNQPGLNKNQQEYINNQPGLNKNQQEYIINQPGFNNNQQEYINYQGPVVVNVIISNQPNYNPYPVINLVNMDQNLVGQAINILAAANSVFIKQEVNLHEMMSGCEQKNRYDIWVRFEQGPHQLLFRCKEESEFCMRICCQYALLIK